MLYSASLETRNWRRVLAIHMHYILAFIDVANDHVHTGTFMIQLCFYFIFYDSLIGFDSQVDIFLAPFLNSLQN